MNQLHLRIQRQKQRQHIRKSKSAENTASHRSQIPELHPDNTPHTLPCRTVGISIQPLMLLQLPQRHHTSNRKLLLGLFNLIQSQPGQINRRLHLPLPHLRPEHPAQDTGASLLIQLIRLLQRPHPDIILNLNHTYPISSIFTQYRSPYI